MRDELYYKYWKQVIQDYIECAFEDYEKQVCEMPEINRNIFFDKVIYSLMVDTSFWSFIDESVSYYVYKYLNEYENEKGE